MKIRTARRRAFILLFLFSATLFIGSCEPLQTPPAQQALEPPTSQSLPQPVAQLEAPSPSPAPSATPIAAATVPAAQPEQGSCQETAGHLVLQELPSDNLDDALPFYVYIPPCYWLDKQARYPVIYLLHGLNFDQQQWISLGAPEAADKLISSGESAPFIMVMPLIPSINKYPSPLNASVLVDELIPYVDANFRTQPERASRAIGGLSRGASWALRLGVAKWPSFSRIGLHSLAMEYDEIRSWVAKLKAIPRDERPALFLDTGNADEGQDSAQSLSFELNIAKIPHTYYLFTGEHEESYWESYLPAYLRWYSQDWQTELSPTEQSTKK